MHAIHRYAKVNGKYMKYFDKTNESSYLKYWDVNNGLAMPQNYLQTILNGFKIFLDLMKASRKVRKKKEKKDIFSKLIFNIQKIGTISKRMDHFYQKD